MIIPLISFLCISVPAGGHWRSFNCHTKQLFSLHSDSWKGAYIISMQAAKALYNSNLSKHICKVWDRNEIMKQAYVWQPIDT